MSKDMLIGDDMRANYPFFTPAPADVTVDSKADQQNLTMAQRAAGDALVQGFNIIGRLLTDVSRLSKVDPATIKDLTQKCGDFQASAKNILEGGVPAVEVEAEQTATFTPPTMQA